MTALGTQTRLGRIFAHPSGRYFSVAVDHFVGYPGTMTHGLGNLPRTLDQVVAGRPDSVTMLAGAARALWGKYAGQLPLIVQTGCFTPDDRVLEQLGQPAEVLRLGADAIAVAIGVRGPSEGTYLKMLESTVVKAEKWGLPVIAHIYPRDYSGAEPVIVTDPDNIAWATRCGIECGADVIKVAYTGDVASFSEITASCPRPVVVAGGLKADHLQAALETAAEALQAGARGLTVGRNVWGGANPTVAAKAFAAVIHQGIPPAQAAELAER